MNNDDRQSCEITSRILGNVLLLGELCKTMKKREIQQMFNTKERAIKHYEKYRKHGDINDLNMAISLEEETIDLLPRNDNVRQGCRSNLTILLMKRFEHAGKLDDLDEAIALQQNTIMLTPQNTTVAPDHLHLLASVLLIRFEQWGRIADLETAISLSKQAIDRTPNSNPIKPEYMNGLGMLFLRRFERLGNVADIDDAVLIHQGIVDSTPDEHASKPMYFSNLGNSYCGRFKRYGKLADIDQAISAQQKATNLAFDESPDKPSILSNLGVAFQSRFEQLGNMEDVDQAILAHQRAVDLAPNNHANKLGYLGNLGISLQQRFDELAKVADIDRAILVKQQVVDLTPNGHAEMPHCLDSLGGSFLSRFERFGEVRDLNRAILTQQRAVDLIPNDHASKPALLNNLGNSFQSRFERFSKVTDINQAILVQQQAVGLTPNGHEDKPCYLNNLGNAFLCRFERFGKVTDIDQAVQVQNQAVNLTPNGHAHKSGRLNNLCNSFFRRFEKFGKITDIDQAISLRQQAVDLTHNDHACRATRLHCLGNSLLAKLRHTSGIYYLLIYMKAISTYVDSALSSTGSPYIRLISARNWASLSFQIPSLNDSDLSSLRACHVLMELVPRVVWLGNSIGLRYQNITSVGDSVNIAASIACTSDRQDLALEWLEQGRSIIWGQILHLRTPIDDLESDYPELAAQVKKVSHTLEILGANLDVSIETESTLKTASRKQETDAQEHRRLAQLWEDLLKRARQCPGYESFLQPPKLSTLAHAASLGPIVIILTERSQCSAIILQSTNESKPNVECVHLKYASLDKITKAHRIFTRALSGRDARCISSEILSANTYENFSSLANAEEEQLLCDLVYTPGDDRASIPTVLLRASWTSRILQMLWTDIVHPVFQALGYTPSACSDTLPHVTWCTTGPLAFLPLHAAGCYDHNSSISSTDSKAYKYAVSSYTPSLSMLLKRKQGNDSQGFRGLAAISQPSTPGQTSLPFTIDEAKKLQDQFGMMDLEFSWLNDASASRDAVLDEMGKRSWIHLACHGVQREGDPMNSAFMLHDGPLDLRTISRETLPHARLAFLSACQTAKGDMNLPEEAAHLAAGMLMSGYHTVIGTMWSIRDQDAPLVAEEFYKYLKSHGMKTNDGQAAYALHKAVARLREKVGEDNFLAWVPFIHLGI